MVRATVEALFGLGFRVKEQTPNPKPQTLQTRGVGTANVACIMHQLPPAQGPACS